MTETVAYIRRALGDIYPPPEIKSLIRILLEQVCGLSPHQQILYKDKELSTTDKEEIKRMVERLQAGEPIQYIAGYTSFLGLKISVNPSVLIPRPETEELVDRIIRNHPQPGIRLLDVGTGSGCIAIALSKYLANPDVVALDVSPEALKVATSNATLNRVNIRFLQTDVRVTGEVLDLLPAFFDIIVSNPPYVMEREKSGMERNVLEYEPSLALFVPDEDPLLFYRSIADIGLLRLNPGGFLYLEINAQCGPETVAMLEQRGYTSLSLIRDLSGRNRFIQAVR